MSWAHKLASIAPIVFGGLGSRILARLKSVEYVSKEKYYVTAEDDPKSQKRSEKEVTFRIEFN